MSVSVPLLRVVESFVPTTKQLFVRSIHTETSHQAAWTGQEQCERRSNYTIGFSNSSLASRVD
jgi:hypothetical protein